MIKKIHQQLSLENNGELVPCLIKTNAISVDTPNDLVRVIDTININNKS